MSLALLMPIIALARETALLLGPRMTSCRCCAQQTATPRQESGARLSEEQIRWVARADTFMIGRCVASSSSLHADDDDCFSWDFVGFVHPLIVCPLERFWNLMSVCSAH